jgi:hypothetical protein
MGKNQYTKLRVMKHNKQIKIKNSDALNIPRIQLCLFFSFSFKTKLSKCLYFDFTTTKKQRLGHFYCIHYI